MDLKHSEVEIFYGDQSKEGEQNIKPQKMIQILSTKVIDSQLFPWSKKIMLNSFNSFEFQNQLIRNFFYLRQITKPTKCNCIKSSCKTNYCQCLKNKNVCSEKCTCRNCENRFKIYEKDSQTNKKGCNCKKSKCIKGYCQCFQKEQKCGPHCRCFGCQNHD